MEVQYFGGNCIRVNTKKGSIVIDDNLEQLGAKTIARAEDIVLNTNPEVVKSKIVGKLVIEQPGEYEVSNVSIQGVSVRAHIDTEGTKATIFKLLAEDIRLVITGHIYPDLTDDQLEAIGTVDVLIIPVGGNGYTLDPVGALKVIKKIEPKIVIPTHFADSKLKYEMPQQDLAAALKEMAMEPAVTTAKLKLKSSDLPENAQLIVLEKN